MGLQGQLSDVSSDSIPLMLLSLLAVFLGRLRSFLHRPCDPDSNLTVDDSSSIIASGLANIIVLADQLSLNRLFSYRCVGEGGGSDCVVCLSKLREGEEVRKLECRHVFHKRCLEGWLHCLNFTCPLCRSALVADGCVSKTQRRVGRDLISCLAPHWFTRALEINGGDSPIWKKKSERLQWLTGLLDHARPYFLDFLLFFFFLRFCRMDL